MSRSHHAEPHYSSRNSWLRAVVLGANDGLISTASLLMGVAAAAPDSRFLLLSGIAAWVGGAVSMSAGEYVSVSSQADTERADLQQEARELAQNPQAELAELAAIYRSRGLDEKLAFQVAQALTKHNALDAHARDEIGLSDAAQAKPLQAAWTSALAFSAGALPPLLVVAGMPESGRLPALAAATLLGLGILGAVSARLGGAPAWPAVRRITGWGVAALALSAMVGKLAGVAV
ncbi:VIT family protein [Neisseria shayeganii]|uniref:VIT family protein n=1 Tax=Neisseria shayeganii 871 TaxID=1032488 RepID=G4CFQ8_9NEIS|nr:VIT family protein [Neisseria shayeganii]EGY53324.1 hypothetical protein HMPREF9371_0433 [Neisseria shayeganii 871]